MYNPHNHISVVIITYNEEDKIRRTVEAVSVFTDDVVVIDSYSTDSTPAICRELNVTFIQQAWSGYGHQKNTGHAYARYDWILSIDADEVVSEELSKELKELLLDSPSTLYNIPFKTYFCNQLVRFGGWNPQFHVRLFNKKMVEWNTLEVHETLHYPEQNSIITLKGSILHYSYDTMEDYLSKSGTYTTLFAERMQARSKRATWIKLYLSPSFTFIKEYIFKLGFLDGTLGFKIACLNFNYTKTKYLKLKALQ
ncbi:MAG: glycosyltransferase family 2 protein [Cytophagales bacterium]|nr:glycosyltransferase family 2 protein [Cytophaga sp.]